MKQGEAKLEREKRPSGNWLDQTALDLNLCKPLLNSNGLGNGGEEYMCERSTNTEKELEKAGREYLDRMFE